MFKQYLIRIYKNMNLLEKLRGKKTFICAVLLGLVTAINALGYMDISTFNTLVGLLGAGSVASLRDGMKG